MKDLVDLALLLTLGVSPDAATVEALRATFGQYATHPLPVSWPEAPETWAERFTVMAGQTELESPDILVWQARLTAFWAQLPLT